MANEAFERSGLSIRFGSIRLVNTPEIYTVTMNAQKQKERQ